MAQTYNSTANIPGLSTSAFYADGYYTIPFSFNIANTAAAVGFANTDIFNLFTVAAGGGVNIVLGMYFSWPALDTGGGLTLEIGDTGSVSRFVASTSTSGQAAYDDYIHKMNAFTAGSLPRLYTAIDTIKITFTHANTTPAVSGIVKGVAYMWGGANPGLAG